MKNTNAGNRSDSEAVESLTLPSMAEALQRDWDCMQATGSYGAAFPILIESLNGNRLQEAIVENDRLLELGHPMASAAAILLQNIEVLRP